MAKAPSKGRTGRQPSKPKPTMRVSTRRAGAATLSRRRALRPGAAPAQTLQVTLDLRDAFGKPVRDPETFFTFRRLSANRQVGDQLAIALTGTSPVFTIPVFSSDAAIVCEIDPKRYRFAQSPVFLASSGAPVHKQCQLLREPKEWTGRFTRWRDLPSSFKSLKDALGASPEVTLFKEVEPIADLVVEDAYDALSGDALTLAKAALLNSYFRLNGTPEPISGSRSWFSFVRRFVAIGRERFLAFVDPEMETLVRQIHAHIDQFRADYERTPAENHRGNVPAALQGRIADMISIKSTHRKGNFQLTMTRLTGPDEVLLDTDIDEHGDLLGHFFDLFKHKLTGGTHPYDVHELLVLQSGASDRFDLGYRLE